MVSKEDFRNNNILGNLTDEMLDKIIPLTELLKFEERDYIFKEGDTVEKFYIIKRGTVLIEQRLSEHMTVTAGTVTTDECFGYSSIFGEGVYSTNAVCSDQCEVFVINGEALMDLMKNDHSMGFYIMQNISVVFGKRVQRRTEQFLRAVTTHPEIHELES